MTIVITLTTAGADTGPFNLYSDVDGFVSAFETGVSKAALVAGYTTTLAPNGTTTVRVMSNNPLCTNYIDIPVLPCGSTTTTTTSSSTTTTSSSTTTTTSTTTAVPPTTTTTTTLTCDDCYEYTVTADPTVTIQWINCNGTAGEVVLSDSTPYVISCAVENSIVIVAGAATIAIGAYCGNTCG